MQSAFKDLLDDLLFAHCFGPFLTALLEVQTGFQFILHCNRANWMSCCWVTVSCENSSGRCLRNALIASALSIEASMRGFEPRLYAPMLMRSSDFLWVAIKSRIS